MEKKSMEEDDHSHRKKRKMNETEEKEENHNEEEAKMEEFFDLIRSTREVRDRLRGSGLIDDQKKEEKIKKDDDNNNNNRIIMGKEIGVWNPTFIPEDFLDGDKKISALPLPLPDSVVFGSTSQLLDHHVDASKMEVEEEEDIVKEDNKGGKDNNNGNNLDLELSL